MIAQQEIRKLPFQEKIALLETVWAEISSLPDELKVPQWHEDLLDQREQALESGTEQILDWEDAKDQIQLAVR